MDIAVVSLLTLGALILFIGYLLPNVKDKRASRVLAWTLTVAIMACTLIIVAGESPLTRMIALISLLMLAMKMLVLNETYYSTKLNFVQWSAFALAWFGNFKTSKR